MQSSNAQCPLGKESPVHGRLARMIPVPPHQLGRDIQKTYQGIARKWITTQIGVDFMKKSWNEEDLNQQTGSSIAAL